MGVEAEPCQKFPQNAIKMRLDLAEQLHYTLKGRKCSFCVYTAELEPLMDIFRSSSLSFPFNGN